MGSFPESRLVLRQDVEVTSGDLAQYDWVSALGTPRAYAAIRITRLLGGPGLSQPIAFVTPIMFTTPGTSYITLGPGAEFVMSGTRMLFDRDVFDNRSGLANIATPGQLNWGLALHLIKGVQRARVEYWQLT